MKPVLRKDQVGAAKAIRELWTQSKHPDRWVVHDLVMSSTEQTVEGNIQDTLTFLTGDGVRANSHLYVADCLATWGLKYKHAAFSVHDSVMKAGVSGFALSVEGVITGFFELYAEEEEDTTLFDLLGKPSKFQERLALKTDFEVARDRLSKAMIAFTRYSAISMGNAAQRSRLQRTLELVTQSSKISATGFFPLAYCGQPKDLLTWIRSELMIKTFLSLSFRHQQRILAGFAQHEGLLVSADAKGT